jgi:hypothetical protein
MTKADKLHLTGRLSSEPELLDADMTKSDLVDVLRRLKFEEQYCTLWLDRPVRDFLIAALTDSHRR